MAHLVWGAAQLAALGRIWASALGRHRGGWFWPALAFLGIQGAGLVAGRGDCPMTPVQRRLGDPVPMFELVLPPRAAKAAVPVLAGVAIAGCALALALGPRATRTAAHHSCRLDAPRRPMLGCYRSR